jgi:hypothetical protein
MTTRTLKFYGRGYGATPASISVTQNGINVYTGEVTTINAPITEWPDQIVLFTSETTVDFNGTIPMSVEVTNGSVVFAWITGNYCSMLNPVYSTEQLEILQSPTSTDAEKLAVYSAAAVPPFSPEEIAALETGTVAENNIIIASHNASIYISSGPDNFDTIFNGDERSNVSIDGIPQNTPTPRPEGQNGTWFWQVTSGSTLTYDLNVNAGRE